MYVPPLLEALGLRRARTQRAEQPHARDLGDPGGRMRDGERLLTEPGVTARCEVVRGAEVVAGANPRDHARPCYMTSKASYTVTLPPPCRTGELFASEVAESSESAWRIV